MSVVSAPGTIEITVQLGELSVTVRGPAVQASELVADLSRNYSRGYPVEESQASESQYSLVEETSRVPTRRAPAPTPEPRLETREEIERTFETCPDYLYTLGNRLAGSAWSSAGRIERAWKAGQWAKAVIAGRAQSPNRTPQIDLRPRYYVILKSDRVPEPVCYQSSGSYWRVIGSLQGSTSVSHSWPSEAEARTYCSGAGVSFPQVSP